MGGLWWFACLCVERGGCLVLRLAHVASGQRMGSMSDLEILIKQMVTEIMTKVNQLDDPRLEMFLDWLTTHSVEMNRAIGNHIAMENVDLRGVPMQDCLGSALKGWLHSVPIQGLLWEYKTVTAEIDWWRDLDPGSLKMILGSDVET